MIVRRFLVGEQRGQALVEFALVLPLMLLVVLGLTDLARVVWQYNTLAYAAREGTRYAIVHGAASVTPVGPTNPSEPNIAAIVRSKAIGVADVTVTTAWPDGNNYRNSRVSVDATAAFVPLPSEYLLGGAFSITVRGGSMLVIQR